MKIAAKTPAPPREAATTTTLGIGLGSSLGAVLVGTRSVGFKVLLGVVVGLPGAVGTAVGMAAGGVKAGFCAVEVMMTVWILSECPC